jgi:hypothetical protein
VICPNNKRRREERGEEGGEPPAYTLTLLPGFLIRHSTVLVEAVQQALESYLGEGKVGQTGAAMVMGCVDPESFRLFYRRMCRRIGGWVQMVLQIVLALGGEITEELQAPQREGVQAQWVWYVLLVRQWLEALERLPGREPMLRPMRWWYVYARLAAVQMGLGP